MSDSPSPNGSIVRASGGRFAAGNAGGHGHPYARRVAELRSLILNVVTDDDLRAIATGMVGRANASDAAVIRELL